MPTSRSKREEFARAPGSIGPGARAALSIATDQWLGTLLEDACPQPSGICLVAVGGYGRMELSPHGDLDLILLHREGAATVSQVAEAIWYPIWDAGMALDHSVRSVAQARRLASRDLKVLLGLLDARAVAGDSSLVDEVRQAIYADWRAMASKRLPELRELVQERRRQHGDLATMLEPDLKEAYGGLREATVLRAIAASWVTDIPHQGWEQAVQELLNARDCLQASTGRPGCVLYLQEQDAVASGLGLPDADDLLRTCYAAARSIAYASDAAWHRVDRMTSRAARVRMRSLRRSGATRVPLAEGIVVQEREVVLAADAQPGSDPIIVLRAAAAAAQAGLPLAPHTVQRLAREAEPLPVPWPHQALDAFVSLLGAGESMVKVWEALDQEGIVDSLIPGWEVVRSAPQRNAIHRFTVDRHLVQTAVQASALTREVERPDLLLVAALLHDFGKARGGDHSIVGAELVAGLGPRLGFGAADTDILVQLVRHHLLLIDTAMRRDLEDPRTIAAVAGYIPDPEVLNLLAALTEADSLATGPGVWTHWKQSLVAELVQRVHAVLAGRPLPQPPDLSDAQRLAWQQSGIWVLMGHAAEGIEITVAAPDEVGLLATVAGVLSVHRLHVRAARVRTISERALQVWTVEPAFGDPPAAERLAEDIRLAQSGALDIAGRLAARDEAYRPALSRPHAAARVELGGADGEGSILEVRAHDAPGLLFRVARAIADADATITGAKVATLGSEVVDVFFLADRQGGPLSAPRGSAVAVAVQARLDEQIP